MLTNMCRGTMQHMVRSFASPRAPGLSLQQIAGSARACMTFAANGDNCSAGPSAARENIMELLVHVVSLIECSEDFCNGGSTFCSNLKRDVFNAGRFLQ